MMSLNPPAMKITPDIRYLWASITLGVTALIGSVAFVWLVLSYLSSGSGLGHCQALGQSCSPTLPAPSLSFWLSSLGVAGLIVLCVVGILILRNSHRKHLLMHDLVVEG